LSFSNFGVYTPKGRIAGASNVFVYTKTLFALQNACWGVPQTPLFCIFQCRLRIPAGRFLPGDTLRVVEVLHEVACADETAHFLLQSLQVVINLDLLRILSRRNFQHGQGVFILFHYHSP